MPSELISTLLTTDDRELLRKELELLKVAVFKLKKDTFADVLKSQVRVSVAQIIEKELRTDKKEPETYVNDILSQLDAIPVLQLTIAFEPNQSSLEHISTQATTLFGEEVILQVTIQPDIIGGAVVVWKGHYTDASLKTKFEAAVIKATAQETHENL